MYDCSDTQVLIGAHSEPDVNKNVGGSSTQTEYDPWHAYLPENLRHVQDWLGNGQLIYGTSSVDLSQVMLLKLSKFTPGCAVGRAPF